MAAYEVPQLQIYLKGVLTPVLLALALRFVLFLAVISHPERFYTVDSHGYVGIAKNLKAAYGGSQRPLAPEDLSRTPVYPLFLAAAFSWSKTGEPLLILVQILLSLLTVVVTYWIGARFGSPQTGRMAAFFLALDPISIVVVNQLQPETLFTFLLVAASFYWLEGIRRNSSGRIGIAGFFFGIAVLTRPIGLYLPLVLLPMGWFLQPKSRLLHSTAFFVMFALPVGGWIVRNGIMAGLPTVSTIEGKQLLEYQAVGALAEDEGLTFREARDKVRSMMRERMPSSGSAAERYRDQKALAIDILMAHPVGAVSSSLKAMLKILTERARVPFLDLLGEPDVDGPRKVVLFGAEFLILACLYSAASLGFCVLAYRRSWTLAAFSAGMILYFLITSTVAGPASVTSPRFRLPMMPYWALLAGYGISALTTSLTEASRLRTSGRDSTADRRPFRP